MSKKKIYIFALLSFFFSFNFISITRWDQINNFTASQYQNISINTDIQAKDLGPGQFYSSWNFFFDNPNNREIKIKSVKVNDTDANFYFNQNNLDIQFDKIFNGQTANIKINYDIAYEEHSRNVKFIKRDCVIVPDFVKNAKVNLVVRIPKNFVVFSNVNFFKKQKNGNLEWSGILKDQINEDISVCLKKALWNVSTLITVFSEKNIQDLNLTTSSIYTGGNNKVKKFFILCNNKKIKYYVGDDEIRIFSPGINPSFMKYQLSAQLENSCDEYFFDASLANDDEIFFDETINFNELAKQIIKNDKTNDPDYAKICRWINGYLKYDLSMAGKKLSAESIYLKRKGVCEHYAILFKRLMHELKISSYVIIGIAYSFNSKKFIPHAWNIIFINGQWLAIDPTWNLYSGIVPTSHIFTRIETNNGANGVNAKVKYKSQNTQNTITMSIQQRAEFISEQQKNIVNKNN